MNHKSDVIWIVILVLLFLLSSATALANLITPEPTCTPPPPTTAPGPEAALPWSLGPALSRGDAAPTTAFPLRGSP